MTSAADNAQGMIKVKLIRAGKVLRAYRVRSDLITIGSGQGCTIRVGGDKEVAKKHATIYLDKNEGLLTVVSEPDAKVYLNEEETDIAVPSPEDLIRIGRMIFQVEMIGATDSMCPPAASLPLIGPDMPVSDVPKMPGLSRASEPLTPASRDEAKATTATPPPSRPLSDTVSVSTPIEMPHTLPPIAPRPRLTAIPCVKVGPATRPANRHTKAEPSITAAPPPVRRSMFPTPAITREPEPVIPAMDDLAHIFGSDNSVLMEISSSELTEISPSDDSILTEIRPSDDPIFAEARRIDDMVDELISAGAHAVPAPRRDTPSDIAFPVPKDVMDEDVYYSYDHEDEESFEVPFDLASQLLATKKPLAEEGPREPYCAAHVIRVVHGHVVEAFGVNPKRPYTTIDGEVHCRITAGKGWDNSRVLLETGHGVTGQVLIDGRLQDLQSLTVMGGVQTIELHDRDSAKLQGAGGDYKIEVYSPPLASRKAPLLAPSLPMLSIVLGLALAFHGVAAYGLGYLHLDDLSGWSKEEKGIFAEVTLDRQEQNQQNPLEQPAVAETPAEDVVTIAERSPHVTQTNSMIEIPSGITVDRNLDRAEVLHMVNSHLDAIEACYEKALIVNPAMSGRIAFGWTVIVTGKVSEVRMLSSTLGSPHMASCISEEIKRWTFSKPNRGKAMITFPFMFRSRSLERKGRDR